MTQSYYYNYSPSDGSCGANGSLGKCAQVLKFILVGGGGGPFSIGHHLLQQHKYTVIYSPVPEEPWLHRGLLLLPLHEEVSRSHCTASTALYDSAPDTVLHCTALQQLTLYYNTLQYIAIHYNALQYITMHYNALQYITMHYNTLQCITIHYNTLQCITIHYRCVNSGQMPCPIPVAYCRPSCYDNMDNHECTCDNEEFPDNWCP